MRRSNVILWGLIIALLALPVLGNMTSAADKTEKVKDYLTWLGSFEAPPVNPQPFGVYFNSLEGSSYIYDTDHWQLFAASGEDGEDGTSVDLTPLMDDIAALTARVEDLEEENEILNMRLEDLAPLASTVSSFTSSIIEDEIHGAVGEELQITVIVNNAVFNPILGLGTADFETSIGTVVDAYDLSSGEYRVTVVIDDPGTHTVELTVDGILLQDSFSAVLANTVSAANSVIVTSSVQAPSPDSTIDSREDTTYYFKVTVKNNSDQVITGLDISDFDFGDYNSKVLSFNENAGTYMFLMEVTGEAYADVVISYNVPITVSGTWIGDVSVHEIDPFYPVGDERYEIYQDWAQIGETLTIVMNPINLWGHRIYGMTESDYIVEVSLPNYTIHEYRPYEFDISFSLPDSYMFRVYSAIYPTGRMLEGVIDVGF